MEYPPAPVPALCNPAGYGEACAGCSRAKCKCFFQSDGSGCERCSRLGRICEPASGARKRKARKELPTPPRPRRDGIEQKLDDVLSLLLSQAAGKNAAHGGPAALSTPNATDTPSTLATLVDPGLPVAINPDLEIDTNVNVIKFLRPSPSLGELQDSQSPIFEDIAVHKISDLIAENQLATFRRAFLPQFPFVHIPMTTTASELRHQKPLLWLVVMSLTSNIISQQFALEETVWKIVSQRLVCQHHADLDSLLGLICFSSWSNYFKRDKPFMCMLTQLAVSLALELCIHKDVPTNAVRLRNSGQVLSQEPMKQRLRTMEERRALLALFSLTSSTWRSYRSTEPLRWTPYMDDCIRILGEAQETSLDDILVTQIKCQLITNQLSCPPVGGPEESRSLGLVDIMLRQLHEIKQSVPNRVRSERSIQLHLCSAELMIRDSLFSSTKAKEQSGFSRLQKLQSLESTLTVAENLQALIFDMPLADWIGFTVETMTQFTHCMVVLFNLTTLDEPGWDPEEVKRRVNVFKCLDRAHDTIECVPVALGMVDADGPRSGFFFKVKDILLAIKALFQMALTRKVGTYVANSTTGGGIGPGSDEAQGEYPFSDDFLLSLAGESWLSDLLDFSSNPGPEGWLYPIST